MVEIKRNQKGNFDVLCENTEVGKIEMMNETDIAYVEIFEEHRGNGYGPKSLREVVDYLLENENKSIRLSTPVDESLESVLLEYSFRKTMDGIWKLDNV